MKANRRKLLLFEFKRPLGGRGDTRRSEPVTTAIYARISLDRQDGAGVERQVADCRVLAAERGWGPVVEYLDNSISASRFSRKPRPAYAEMLEAAQRGDIQRIVCYHLDRLYRQPRELEPIIELADRGLIVADVEKGDLDLATSDGRYGARILVAGAAKESDDKSRRVRRAKQQNREQGNSPGGPRPFGWTGYVPPSRPGEKRTEWSWTQPHPTEAPEVRDAMQGIIDGRSLADTARDWNAREIQRPRTGATGTWQPSNVRQVLVSPRHAGLIGYGGAVIGKAKQWEPIVTRELWERCVAALDSRSQSWGSTPRRRSLLTGLLVCGRCGKRMVRATQSRKGGNVSVWRCSTLPGTHSCGNNTVLAAPLDDAVVELALTYLDTADPAAFAQPDGPNGDTAAILAELADLAARDKETAALAAAGKIRPAAFAAFSSGIEAQERALRERLDRVGTRSAGMRWAGRGNDLRKLWNAVHKDGTPVMTKDEQRAVLQAVLVGVAVMPRKKGQQPLDRLVWPVPKAQSAR
jgi:site-specific DNA recombinase